MNAWSGQREAGCCYRSDLRSSNHRVTVLRSRPSSRQISVTMSLEGLRVCSWKTFSRKLICLIVIVPCECCFFSRFRSLISASRASQARVHDQSNNRHMESPPAGTCRPGEGAVSQGMQDRVKEMAGFNIQARRHFLHPYSTRKAYLETSARPSEISPPHSLRGWLFVLLMPFLLGL